MREFNLLANVYRSNATLPPGVTIPPGDDMGAIQLGQQTVLVTVDQLADGIHADLATTSLDRVGRKAITRNLSDVAAMAAKPIGAVVAVSLPRDFSEHRANQLFQAMRNTADDFQCPLFGGDIAIWNHPLLITVTVLAEPAGIQPVLRHGAQPGDTIYVTGTLGGSLETLPIGYTHHLDFTPRLDLARQLAANPATRPTAMIDLSDGLARDLQHLCNAANLNAELLIANLPLSHGAHQAAQRTGQPAWQHALGDGEDYELLFTAPPGLTAPANSPPITPIGTMTPSAGGQPTITLRHPDGRTADLRSLTNLGWEHHT